MFRSRWVRDLVVIGIVLLITRSYIYGFVFRGGDVVLLANDPYARLTRILAVTTAAGGIGEFVDLVSGTHRYPLFIATLSALVEVLGGDRTTAETVVAWYPVVTALATGGLVYATARRVTEARWGGLIAGISFAITPVVVVRMALGFGDHHAFDYGWLALTVWALVVLVKADNTARIRWAAAGTIAVAMAAQVLAWRGGVLLLVPLGMYVQYRVLVTVRDGRSPARTTGLLLGALGVGAGLAFLGHRAMAWFSTLHALLPVVLVGAASVVVLAGELARRTPAPITAILCLEGVGILMTGALVWGPLQALLREAVAYQAKVTRWDVVEGMSLFGGGPVGVVTGPVSLFGLLLVVALPGLALATWHAARTSRPAVGAIAGYAWYFLALATVQRRFAAALAVVVAPLVAVGVLALASQLGVVQGDGSFPVSAGKGTLWLNTDVSLARVALLTLVVMTVISASFVLIPLQLNQVTYSQAEYDATQAMEGYAADRGWTLENGFVFSQWGHTRMYNYHIYDTAPWYSYARRNYPGFLASGTPDAAYRRHRDHVGFVVTTDAYRPPVRVVNGSATRSVSMYTRLHEHRTSRAGGVPGLANYRLLWASGDGALKVFTLVPGATITGRAAPNATVTVTTTVVLDRTTLQYRRVATANATGQFSVTVPYPGEYTVGTESMAVGEAAVTGNQTIQAGRVRSTGDP